MGMVKKECLKFVSVLCAVAMIAPSPFLSFAFGGGVNTEAGEKDKGIVVLAERPAASPSNAGKTGDVDWSYYDDEKLLVLSGNGATDDYGKGSATKHTQPWKDYDFTKVIVEDEVTRLGDHLFSYYSNLETVELPDNGALSEIGEGVFRQTGLTEIKIPQTVTSLGRAQFYGCRSLLKADLQGTYTVLDQQVLAQCDTLQELKLTGSVKSLKLDNGIAPLGGCTALKKVIYGGTQEDWKAILTSMADATSAGKKVLYNSALTVECANGIYTYQEGDENSGGEGDAGQALEGMMPDTQVRWKYDPDTTTLTLSGSGRTPDYNSTTAAKPWNAFKDEITTVVVEEGISRLGNNLFSKQMNMKEIELPERGLTELGAGVFRESGWTQITIPETVTQMGRAQFYGCSSLESLKMQGTFTVLYEASVGKCTSLKEVWLPGTVKELNLAEGSNSTKAAFYQCTSLSNIHYGDTIEEWKKLLLTTEFRSDLTKTTITVHCTDGDYIYGQQDIDGKLVYSLENGVLKISGTGEIPDYESGTAAPWGADAAGIRMVIIYDGVTKIGANAFGACVNLETVNYIGYRQDWERMVSEAGKGNEPLFSAAFVSGTSGMLDGSVTWELDIETWTLTISGQGSMPNWTSANQCPWVNSVSDIRKAVVEEGVTSISWYTFANFCSLTDVEIAGTVESIGTYAFSGCISLEKITFPEGLRVIGSKVFNSCVNLGEVWVPSTLEIVDMKAFEGAGRLKNGKVTYNGTRIGWERIDISRQQYGNENLLGCANITFLKMPEKVTELYEDIAPDAWYKDAVQYLTDYGWIRAEEGCFGSEDVVSIEEILEMLYSRAGAPGMYDSAWEWAECIGLAEMSGEDTVSLAQLAVILYRMAKCNGVAVAIPVTAALSEDDGLPAEETVALAWCREMGFTNVLMDSLGEYDVYAPMTRAGISTVIAAYLRSGVSEADRYDEMTEEIKSVLAAGGDGRMYVITPKKFVEANDNSQKCGDCTILIFPEGSTMLIDGGNTHCTEPILELLERIGLEKMDYFVLSHPHVDHVGGMKAIAEYLYGKSGEGCVGQYYTSRYQASTEPQLREYLRSTVGTEIHADVQVPYDFPEIDGVAVDILNPTEQLLQECEALAGTTIMNNISLAMKFTYGESTYLTCGDLYRNREITLIEERGDELKADVMKANHHGTYNSNCVEWLDTVGAMIIVSDSDDNGSQDLVDRSAARDVAFYAEGLDGLIVVTLDDSRGYTVKTQNNSVLRRNYHGTIGKIGDSTESEPPTEPETPVKPGPPAEPETPAKTETPAEPETSAVPEDRPEDGGWRLDASGWWFRYADGSYPKAQWERLLYNGRTDWYFFDRNGYMMTGWLNWNNRWFYLNPVSDGWKGRMLVGWAEIDGKWYYFEPTEGPDQGSLYVNRMTPDGYRVTVDGNWDGLGK